jgi:hypothetical protein
MLYEVDISQLAHSGSKLEQLGIYMCVCGNLRIRKISMRKQLTAVRVSPTIYPISRLSFCKQRKPDKGKGKD